MSQKRDKHSGRSSDRDHCQNLPSKNDTMCANSSSTQHQPQTPRRPGLEEGQHPTPGANTLQLLPVRGRAVPRAATGGDDGGRYRIGKSCYLTRSTAPKLPHFLSCSMPTNEPILVLGRPCSLPGYSGSLGWVLSTARMLRWR